MKNYNEIIKKVMEEKTLNKVRLEEIITEYNNDITDNNECKLDFIEIEKAVKMLNDKFEKDFLTSVVVAIGQNRKNAFETLIKCPTFEKIVVSQNENKTIKKEDKTSIFKFAKLENEIQSYNQPLDVNGKVIKDKSKTVFGALRFYGLCETFIRNMFISNVNIDSDVKFDISKVKIDDVNIFTEKDGECFKTNSNNALEKQLNILVKFFDLDVKMLKKDLPILKLSAQKIKRDTDNKSSINEIKVLKFVDVLFSVIGTRYNNENVKVFTSDGTEIKEKEENTTK